MASPSDVSARSGSDLRRGRVLDHGNGDALAGHEPRGVGQLELEGLLAKLTESGRPANGLWQFAEVFFGVFGALKKGEDPKKLGSAVFWKIALEPTTRDPNN